MNAEIWLPIKGYEGLYEISNRGRVKALSRRVDSGKCHREWKEHLSAYGTDAKGYFRVALSKNGKSETRKVHRLVAEAFLPNPKNLPQVNHKDGNKQNNAVENLEWCDGSENLHHAYLIGLKKVNGEHNPSAKLSCEDVLFIRKNYVPRDSEFGATALGKRFGVHRKTIGRIVSGSHWKKGDDDVKRKTLSASD